MRGNGWRTALPVFLLSATLSTAVFAAGGLNVGGLGRAIPGIAPAPYLSPFAVVDGVAVTLPSAAEPVAETLLAFDRIPQPPDRADDVPPRPRPRPVAIAGEDTVRVEVPLPGEPARRRTVRRPASPEPPTAERRSGGSDRADASEDEERQTVSPESAPVPDEPAKPGEGGGDEEKRGRSNRNAHAANRPPRATPPGNGNGNPNAQGNVPEGPAGQPGQGQPGRGQPGQGESGQGESAGAEGRPSAGNEDNGSTRDRSGGDGGQGSGNSGERSRRGGDSAGAGDGGGRAHTASAGGSPSRIQR